MGELVLVHTCSADGHVTVYTFPSLSETFMQTKSAGESLMSSPVQNVELSLKYAVYTYI